jgi:hypothetical protein
LASWTPNIAAALEFPLSSVHQTTSCLNFWYATNWNKHLPCCNNYSTSWFQTRLCTLVEKDPLHDTGMSHRPPV